MRKKLTLATGYAVLVLAAPGFRMLWSILAPLISEPGTSILLERVGRAAVKGGSMLLCFLLAMPTVEWLSTLRVLRIAPPDPIVVSYTRAARQRFFWPTLIFLFWPVIFYMGILALYLLAPGFAHPAGHEWNVWYELVEDLWAVGIGGLIVFIAHGYRTFVKLAPYCSCGYSLRGGASDRCPECGRRIEGGDGGENA